MGKAKKRFSDLKVNTKLAVLIGIFMLSLVTMGSLAIFMFRSSQTLTMIMSAQRVFIEKFYGGIENFHDYIISDDITDLKNSQNQFDTALEIAITFATVDSIIAETPGNDWVPALYEVFKEGIDYDIGRIKMMGNQISILSKIDKRRLEEIQGTAISAQILANNIKTEINAYSANPSPERLIQIDKYFADITTLNKEFASKVYELNDYVIRTLVLVVVLLLLLLIGGVTLISYRISQSISSPIKRLVGNYNEIAKGNLKSSVKIESQNELGELSAAFIEIQDGLQNVITYTQKVAGGDYTVRLQPKSEKDELSPALNQMAQKLQEAKQKTENENWLQDGINKLDDQMRGNYSVRELSDRIITFLSKFLQVEMGAVFVYDDILEHLEFTGSIGIKKDEVQEFIQPGEGLIGKVAKQGALQIIDTKEKYHKTFSGTGEILPGQIYLLPMHYNSHIQAVIELAPIHELSELKIEFLHIIKERISVNLSAAVARFRNTELLNQTMEQAKILEQRDKELSQKLEENQKIQAELVKETALLDSMLRTIPDKIHFKDTDGKFIRISESLLELFDANDADELIGKSDFDFYKKREAEEYLHEEKDIMESGEGVIDVINENLLEDGTKTWTSVSKLPLYDKTGTCIGTFSISKDITDIKQLEIQVKSQNDKLISNQDKLENTIEKMNRVQAELEREKALMDSLLDSLPDAIYFKDKDSRFIKVSKSLPKLFNQQKPEDLYGKTDFDFFEKEHAEKAYNDEQEIIRTKKPMIGKVEKEAYENGRVRYVSTTKMPMFNEKKEVIGTFGISRDITKIKQLELEVNERNEALKIQQEELKATNEELKTQEEELRVANEELAEQTKVLTENEKNLQTQQEELRVTNEELGNKSSLLEKQKSEISIKNENLLKTQNELRNKAKELEQASQYKSEFLANMSHELRTPLNSLLILSKLLGTNKKGNLTEDQVKSINIINKSGNDLLNLINEILDLSKIEAGKMKYDFSDVAVDDLVSEINQGFKPVAENKKLELEIVKSDKFPAKLYTDKQRIMQIIKNLLSNAFKFTSVGKVKVEFGLPDTSTLFVNEKLNRVNTCFIAVEDTGVGIPKDKAGAIFEAFQQADGSISRKFGGTGLGLSISKQLTQVLGGEIHLDSEEGEGSIFTIYLPTDKNLVGAEEKEPSIKPEEELKDADEKETTDLPPAKKPEKVPEKQKLPQYINDDRNANSKSLLVLVIHGDKEKAQKLVDLCHVRKYNVLAAASIPDGILLADEYNPQAVIISTEFAKSKELKLLKQNTSTKNLPQHIVSKIDDSVLDDIKEGKGQLNTSNQNSGPGNYKEILVVEDDEATREAIQMVFESTDIIIHEATTAGQAYDLISTKPFDSVILDLGLPDYSGKELLKKLKKDKIPIPNVIINTAKELSSEELRELRKYSESIVIKGVKSDERLMDEVTLFLHQVENTLPKSKYPINKEDIDDEGFKGKKVLVVDDDIRNIFALAQILEEREIEVLEAENGQVAIDILTENTDIDLVLMDIMMPVMNGYEAMTEIRKIPELQEIPIITLTAKAMKEDYQKAIDSGANDYISKPVDMDKLMSLLKIWLFR